MEGFATVAEGFARQGADDAVGALQEIAAGLRGFARRRPPTTARCLQ
jgi:hypothetical protein